MKTLQIYKKYFIFIKQAKKHIKELGYNYFECSALT